MHAWIKKIYMCLELLNFVTLTVFGIAGLTATFEPGPGHPPAPAAARYEPFAIPPNASDKEVKLYFKPSIFPYPILSRSVPCAATRRTNWRSLSIGSFYTRNGHR